MELPELAPSTAPIGRLKCVQFSLLSEEQIVRLNFFLLRRRRRRRARTLTRTEMYVRYDGVEV